MRRTITVGPFSIFFTNANAVMALRTHSHFAQVTLTYATGGEVGFPSFADTHQDVHDRLQAATARPFRDATNERVADTLWDLMEGWTPPAAARWGGDYSLRRLELAVRGVPDRIGHADAFTTYAIERED